jgi:hypothetical protein
MHRRAALPLTAALLGLCGCGVGDPREFNTPHGRYRLVFPGGFGPPRIVVRALRHQAASCEVYTVTAQSATASATAAHLDLPEGAPEPSPDALCRDAVAALEGTIVAGPAEVADQPGLREVAFRLPAKPAPTVGRARVGIDRGRLFQFIYLTASEADLSGADANTFFSSIRILPPAGAPREPDKERLPAELKSTAPPDLPGPEFKLKAPPP